MGSPRSRHQVRPTITDTIFKNQSFKLLFNLVLVHYYMQTLLRGKQNLHLNCVSIPNTTAK
jgi:hypothetical protein